MVLILLVLAGCLPLPITPTLFPVQDTPILVAPSPTSEPTSAPRTLVICLGSEPGTLYPYDYQILSGRNVLEAIYDGPIDSRSYAYQPVILEKLPSLADGDAVLQPVSVQAGDQIVDADGQIIALVEGARYLPSGCQSPDCAVEYTGTSEVQMDQLAVTFRLLPDLKWSDGAPLTAPDSVYSFQLAGHPDTPKDKFKEERTFSYEALDPVTARWVGLPGFLDQTYFLNFWSPLPEHLWGEYTAVKLLEAEFSSRMPVGWGPYVIDEWEQGSHLLLHKNPLYFRAVEGLPKFDVLIFRIIGNDAGIVLAALLSGECDFADQEASFNATLDVDHILELEADRKLDAHVVSGSIFEHADFAISPAGAWDGFSATGAFRDVRLRHAIALCMDRRRVAAEVFSGQSIVPSTYLPPQHPLFNPGVTHYDFDPQAGSALLDEIGWLDTDANPATPRTAQNVSSVPDGALLSFFYWTTTATQRQQATQILAESLAQCGIQVTLQYWNTSDFFAEEPDGPLFGRRFDLAQFASLVDSTPPCNLWLTENIPGDPNALDSRGNPLFPQGWAGENVTGYSSPEYDTACKSALAALPGQPAYAQYHLLAQTIFANDLPVIPLYIRLMRAATRPDFCWFALDPTTGSDTWNIEEFDYGAACP